MNLLRGPILRLRRWTQCLLRLRSAAQPKGARDDFFAAS
jgi:hypothetical protein